MFNAVYFDLSCSIAYGLTQQPLPFHVNKQNTDTQKLTSVILSCKANHRATDAVKKS
jgi:hypothetical protein